MTNKKREEQLQMNKLHLMKGQCAAYQEIFEWLEKTIFTDLAQRILEANIFIESMEAEIRKKPKNGKSRKKLSNLRMSKKNF